MLRRLFQRDGSAPVPSHRGYDMVSQREIKIDPRNHFLHLHDVCKMYGQKIALDNVDFRVARGEFVALVGPSGCGKTTLLNLILGQESATAGELYLDGEPIGYPDSTRGIVTQQYSLFPHLSVLDNIILGHRLSMPRWEWRWRHEEFEQLAIQYLTTAQLEDKCGSYPHELSGGQRQRAAVLQALMKDPKMLLMDEPFGALDPGVRVRMQTFLLEKWEETKKTVIFVTHDLEEAVFLATRVIVLSQYYTEGTDTAEPRGSRIVCDIEVGQRGEPASSRSKLDPRFTATIEEVRRYVLKPDHLWHLNEFDLRHPDSFHTVAVPPG